MGTDMVTAGLESYSVVEGYLGGLSGYGDFFLSFFYFFFF